MKRLSPIFNKWVLTLIICLSLLSLAMDQVFSSYVIMKSPISNEYKLNRLLRENVPSEIPIFGSSKARSAFIPDSLGEMFFNYGMEKCGFDVVNFLLEIEMMKDKNTPVLIELNHRSFISDPSHTINLATYLPNIHDPQVENFLLKNDRMELRYHIPGLRYFGSYSYYLRYYFKGKAGSKKIISKGGNFSKFVLPENVFQTLVVNRLQLEARKKELEEKVQNIKLATSAQERLELQALKSYLNFTFNQNLLDTFLEIVETHPNRDFYLVYSPQHWSETQGISNKTEMIDTFKELSQERTNLIFLDYSNLALPDSGFKNTSHLNLNGAQIFSSALKKDLVISEIPSTP